MKMRFEDLLVLVCQENTPKLTDYFVYLVPSPAFLAHVTTSLGTKIALLSHKKRNICKNKLTIWKILHIFCVCLRNSFLTSGLFAVIYVHNLSLVSPTPAVSSSMI